MTDSPMSFTRYRRDRLMELWDDSGVPMPEVREAYPEAAMKLEWESMLDRCAERGLLFHRQLLQSLPVEFQRGINRRSNGASMPEKYVIPATERRKCTLCWRYRNGALGHEAGCMGCEGIGYVAQ